MKTALKDNDFRRHMGQITLEESGEKRRLLEIVTSDADFFERCQIMDYSLLIGQILILSDKT